MSEALRGFVRVHQGLADPLTVVQQTSAGEAMDPVTVARVAGEVGWPAAAVEGARSFFSDLAPGRTGARECLGTACHLAAGGRLGGGAEAVHCLGHCHAAPARLTADGAVLAAGGPAEVRCDAPEAIITKRLARGDLSELDSALAAGVYGGLRRALARGAEWLLAEVEAAGLRGRGGAGFRTGGKWRIAAQTPAARRYVVVNGDEGDPGSFVDRLLLEHDPHTVIEGLAICAVAIGADRGIIYIRSEYPEAIARMRRAVAQAAAACLLPPGLHLAVHTGRGSYVCGEETALLNALEGFRGEVRLRPPYPAEAGLYGLPTVVNNVETVAAVPWIVSRGATAYAALGTAASAGTKAICLDRGFARPGLVEVEFGRSLREVIAGAGGGRDGVPLEAVIVGGPMGSVLTPDRWELPICYGAMGEAGVRLGHGGLVAVPEGTDMRALLLHLLRFMADESCGKCVPCRLGSQAALAAAEGGGGQAELEPLLEVMAEASLCGFGQLMPALIREVIDAFGSRVFGRGDRP